MASVEAVSGSEPLRERGLIGGEDDRSLPAPNKLLVTGVMVPGVPADLLRRFRASEAARSSRFVVPSAFVEPERAEHTMATLC